MACAFDTPMHVAPSQCDRLVEGPLVSACGFFTVDPISAPETGILGRWGCHRCRRPWQCHRISRWPIRVLVERGTTE